MEDEADGETAHGRPALSSEADASPRQVRRAARRADKAVRHRRVSVRLEYALDRFLASSPLLQLVLLCLFAFAVAGAFGLAASFFLSGDADLDSAQKGFWWALNRMLDGGNVNSDTGVVRRVLGVSVTMIGVVLVAALTSAFVTISSEGLAKLHGGKAVVFERGHLLILGWSSRAGIVVRELALLPRKTTIVILAQRERGLIEAEVRGRIEELASAGLYRGKLRCIVRTGDPTAAGAVRIVNPRHARVALILPEATREGDEPGCPWAMRALLALRRETQGSRMPVVVEVADEEGDELVRLAAGQAKHISIVRSRDVVARVLVETMRQAGVVEVIKQILSLGGPSLVLHAPPPGSATFGELHGRIDDAVLVGVLEGDRALFLPDPGLRVTPAHRLIVLSAKHERPSMCGAPLAPAPNETTTNVAPTSLRRLLLVGYKPEVPDLLRLLDGHVDPGARATLLVPGAERERAVEAVGALALHRLVVEVESSSARPREALRAAFASSPYDVAVFLADDVSHEAVEDADARQLVQLLVGRRARDELGSTARLVVEVRSPDTVRLVQRGKRAGDFVVSREVVGMLLAQEVVASFQDRRGAKWATAIYRDMFDAEGVEVEVRPIGAYAQPAEALSFGGLAARALGRGEIALGFFDGEQLTLAPARGDSVPTDSHARAVVMAGARARTTAQAGEASGTP